MRKRAPDESDLCFLQIVSPNKRRIRSRQPALAFILSPFGVIAGMLFRNNCIIATLLVRLILLDMKPRLSLHQYPTVDKMFLKQA